MAKWGNYEMSESTDPFFAGSANTFATDTNRGANQFFGRTSNEFLPAISPAQIDQIKGELSGMIGQRIVLTNDQVMHARRAVNLHMQDTNVVLTNAMLSSRLVAVLSGEPTAAAQCIAALHEGGATHLAINVPKIFQPPLDQFQNTGMKSALTDLLKARGFKHPLALLEGAASLGVKLVAVGDQVTDQADRKAASIESVAIDVSNILDGSAGSKVILWAGSHYIKRSPRKKECVSAVDYLALNYPVYTVHNGNYLIDGGPLRKIVFDLQCPGIVVTGKDRTVDSLPTGCEGDVYGNWDAIILRPKPTLDHSYFLTND